MGIATLHSSSALFLVLIRRKWQVTPKIHPVVQDAADLDNFPFGDPIQEKVTSPPTVSRHVEGTEARHDLVAGF